MSSPQPSDAVYTLSKIEYLFNAPDKDVFSRNVSELRGESALERFLREHEQDLKSNSILPRLIIKLPVDQITPGLEEKVRDGLRRYSEQTIDDNRLSLQILSKKGLRQTGIGLLLLGLCLTIAWGLPFVQGPPIVHTAALILSQWATFIGFVIGWAVLSYPVEIFLLQWIPIRDENNVLGQLYRMEIKIVPQD
jgi:hypothetical protein